MKLPRLIASVSIDCSLQGKAILSLLMLGLSAGGDHANAAEGAISSWRINRRGQLELRQALRVMPSAGYIDHDSVSGPRIIVDVYGTPSKIYQVNGLGLLLRARISKLDQSRTRLELEFSKTTRIDSRRIKLVGTSPDTWVMEFAGLPQGSVSLTNPGPSLSSVDQFYDLSVKPTEHRLSELESAEIRNWRWFGNCAYRWTSWKLEKSTGIRTTLRTCAITSDNPSRQVRNHILGNSFVDPIYVDCGKLRIRWHEKHGDWTFPVNDNREMVIALCANVHSTR